MDSDSRENIVALHNVFSGDTYLYRNFMELYRTLWINTGSRCLEGYLRPNGSLSLKNANNILIDADLKTKLIDFSSMLRLSEGRRNSEHEWIYLLPM
ncbi:hypothetical protein BDY19DRAFT_997797 [Irpex rosettiformis]|uniref:Uncharacterized protein n=1 Tax=Irpex rosettiformis TaxID=378272 RepID=A0ACB8TQK2_9APHY|nr:hypothetical protein BDY19DRAFT_997797 [Irpex rosettiformis]